MFLPRHDDDIFPYRLHSLTNASEILLPTPPTAKKYKREGFVRTSLTYYTYCTSSWQSLPALERLKLDSVRLTHGD